MKIYVSNNVRNTLLWILYSVSFVSAQNDETASSASEVLEESVGDVKRHIPTNKEGVKEHAKTSARVVQPALDQASVERAQALKRMHEHALRIQQNQTRILQSLESGNKVARDQDIANKQKAIFQLEELKQQVRNLNLAQEEGNDELVRSTEQAIYSALQVAGEWLEVGSFQESSKMTPTQETIATYQKLEASLSGYKPRKISEIQAKGEQDPQLKLKSLASSYALTNLPVPIHIEAPPHADIVLSVSAGGLLGNDMPLQRLKADAEGMAETYWYTPGDAIGNCHIDAFSPQCSNRLNIQVEVVKLKLENDFPSL